MNRIAVLTGTKTMSSLIHDMLLGLGEIEIINNAEDIEEGFDILIIERTLKNTTAKKILENLSDLPNVLLIVADRYNKDVDGEFYSFVLRKPFSREELLEAINFTYSVDKIVSKEKNVLIVDDSKITRTIVKKAITVAGYNVLEAENGNQAIEKLKKMDKLPFLIITDQEMPEMTGIEFAQKIKQMPYLSEIPIVMVTSLYENFELRKKAFESGINDFLPKPLKEEILEAILFKYDIFKKEKREIKAIIIDDSKVQRKTISTFLRNEGIKVFSTGNSKKFSEVLEDNDFNIVLTDFLLENTTGLEVVKNNITGKKDIPVILYTSFDNIVIKKKIEEFYKYGINDYILSPFEKEEIIFKINTWIKHYQLLIELDERLKRIEKLTEYDQLTGILNRFSTFKRGEEYLSLSIRRNLPFSLLYIDIDYFKEVNDKYGHKIGDIVLTEFSKKVNELIRKEDVFGRIGGEEFLIILPFTDKDNAKKVAQKILEEIKNLKFKDIPDLSITVSIGISYLKSPGQTFEELLKIADSNLYKAKKLGRNRIVCE